MSPAGQNVPLLTDTMEVLVETVGHNNMHANQVVGGLEAADGKVSLSRVRNKTVGFMSVCWVRRATKGPENRLNSLPCIGLERSPPLGAYPEAL